MLISYLKDLAEIVNIDSGSLDPDGVTRVAEVMRKHFAGIGFATELVDMGPGVGKGLFATNKPQADRYDLLLNAHLDTVFPKGTAQERPFALKGDYASGPGVSDCKSGVMAIFYAIKNCAREDLDQLAIAVCYNPDEEISSIHSRGWLQSIAKKSRRAFVFEAARSQGAMVRSRKGRSVWKITVHGIASHAGNNPKAGRSAILAAAKLIGHISALQDLDGKGTSVNIGRIEGGTLPNVVADCCTLMVDTRRWNDVDGKELDEAIEKLCKGNWGDGITVQAQRLSWSPAMPFDERNKELVDLINESARIVGFTPQWTDAGGGSDANRIAQVGTPVLDGMGPAGEGFHSEREKLFSNTVCERIEMVTTAIHLLARQG